MAKILIVDDSLIIRKTLERIVTEKGHEVIATGKDGIEGVDLYTKHQPDVMFLDITMPNKDGKECLKEIIEKYPDAKIIMFSAISDEEEKSRCISLGASRFINKGENLMQEENKEKIVQAVEELSQ